jgi:hypothetical protein
MNDLKKLSTEIAASPSAGWDIVWRFKDNKGWRIGRVTALYGGYKIVEIQEGSWPPDRVSLDDIDWHRK